MRQGGTIKSTDKMTPRHPKTTDPVLGLKQKQNIFKTVMMFQSTYLILLFSFVKSVSSLQQKGLFLCGGLLYEKATKGFLSSLCVCFQGLLHLYAIP